MTTLRAAAQQALEALESCDAAHLSDGGQQWYDEKLVEPAITALRAALAQQAEPVEPVATLTAQRDALLEALQEAVDVCIWPNPRLSDAFDKARAAIKAAEEGK